MATILVVRANDGERAGNLLLEHQALLGVTRSILAAVSVDTQAMTHSGHRILVPAHLDIVPLLTLVADDYTEFVEPESGTSPQTAPFTLYWDDVDNQEDVSELAGFMHPRWFDIQEVRLSLQMVVTRYKPDVCVLLTVSLHAISNLKVLDYTFEHLIIFSSLIPSGHASFGLEYIADKLTVADRDFENAIADSMRSLGLPLNKNGGFGFWASLYGNEESLPELEPFIAFGPAFEMAMFGQR